MTISAFITDHMEQLLVEWEAFATSFGAVADNMSSLELRDHAKQILEFVARDIQREESAEQTERKSHGRTSAPGTDDSASVIHGKLRFASGFTLLQLIAEYRALRASVLKLWQQDCGVFSARHAEDMMRFNEAIDQSLADAAVAYSDKLHETRDTFLAILGHDLRGPLAATATAGTYLARPGAFDDRVRQIGVRVKRGAATMSGMVDNLLGLARTQLGEGIPIEPKECDLLEMCQWAVEDAQAAHPDARFDLHATGELMGTFDRARLQQLLTNLANNAAQYGTPGKPIDIKIVGQNDDVLLRVENRGPAIPKEALPHLFTSLVQLPAEEGNARPASSLGLGLFIAKQIAVAHGGDIVVDSDEVNGTAFAVRIPRQ
ncbi:sensor histidine kinase KdpD [Massilia sp. AB1]|uniref:sensor histidine kinase n=1 Tax=Massilia sp. AB1 TaxID=2823371 RepID=UPI001E293EEE|nr:HAMP domain-containing sensor histidine kinase [Massilia sp. AB1]